MPRPSFDKRPVDDGLPFRRNLRAPVPTHHHGAVQPFIAGAMESESGYDTYRVYLLFDDDVGMSMYAGASILLA